ncbi:MAG: exodeoxyribonuclease III [Chloroflexi bacterium RBG_16_56_11]|nr:MAG: exodeoxyribonuclease III [Chloroflexi bacterium RBG_16_56_11]
MGEIRLLSWNVNGIRALTRKGFFEWLARDTPDVLCLQETKVHPDQVNTDLRVPPGYHTYWNSPERKGHGGVALFSKMEPLNLRYDFDSKFDVEGRVIIAEYADFTLFNVYFPNGKQGPERLRYKMKFYDVFLDYADALKSAGKRLVICGDVNTAHKEIDIARPKENSKVSGFLPEERAWIDIFITHGYVDTFRHFHQEPNQYTWWDIKTGARARNVGWRIDYFFVSENLLPSVTGGFIESDVMGSDHCPIGITLRTG